MYLNISVGTFEIFIIHIPFPHILMPHTLTLADSLVDSTPFFARMLKAVNDNAASVHQVINIDDSQS